MLNINKIYNKEDLHVLSCIPHDVTHVLDYACGLGRYLYPLKEKKIKVTGVDKNDDIVKNLQSLSFNVMNIEDFNNSSFTYDCIILSHIIEHLMPKDLMELLDSLLERCQSGGYIIISTPTDSNEFYDDYDHCKPYTHKSISILFSDYEQQAEKPKNRIRCEDVWFRKWPLMFFYRPGEYTLNRLIKSVANSFLFLLYIITFSLISRKTGWVGRFRVEK